MFIVFEKAFYMQTILLQKVKHECNAQFLKRFIFSGHK